MYTVVKTKTSLNKCSSLTEAQAAGFQQRFTSSTIQCLLYGAGETDMFYYRWSIVAHQVTSETEGFWVIERKEPYSKFFYDLQFQITDSIAVHENLYIKTSLQLYNPVQPQRRRMACKR